MWWTRVAMLAGISSDYYLRLESDYYLRLEQGRDRSPSVLRLVGLVRLSDE